MKNSKKIKKGHVKMTDEEFDKAKRLREEIGRLNSFRNSAMRGYIDVVTKEGLPLRLEPGTLMYRCVMDMLGRNIKSLEDMYGGVRDRC